MVKLLLQTDSIRSTGLLIIVLLGTPEEYRTKSPASYGHTHNEDGPSTAAMAVGPPVEVLIWSSQLATDSVPWMMSGSH